MGMTGIAKMVTQSIRYISPRPWGSCLGLNKCAEIFSDPTHNVSVEPTLHRVGVIIDNFDQYRAASNLLLDSCLINSKLSFINFQAIEKWARYFKYLIEYTMILINLRRLR
jgi:hypothetical protein